MSFQLQTEPTRPSVPLPLAVPARALFKAIALARGSRALHPQGVAFTARLDVADCPEYEGTLLGEPGSHEAVLRLSRATGLPQAVPDMLGLALRVPDAGGPGEHQDLLLTTSYSSPIGRHVLCPGALGFFWHTYSSLLMVSIAGHTRVLTSRPPLRRRSPFSVDAIRNYAPGNSLLLCAAPLGGQAQRVARIEVGEPLSPEANQALEFNPWHAGGGIRPTGPFMGIRAPAYAGSVEGRHAAGD